MQTTLMSADPEPTPKLTKGKREKIIAQSLSLNLHAVGLYFVGRITGIEEIPVVNPTPPEREEQQLTDTRFRASVRGWINQAHQHRAQTLLDMREERMTATLQRDKDIILIPRDWWKDETQSLGPGDLVWWYTVNKSVKFHTCKVYTERRGEDLEEETRATLSKECKGCAEIFQEPIKTGGKRTRGKGNKPMTKKTQTQVVK